MLIRTDRDVLACWLRSYNEAVQMQKLVELEQLRRQKRFFTSSSQSERDFSSPWSLTAEVATDQGSGEETDSEDDPELLEFDPFRRTTDPPD
jgi:hypothetical protein